MASVNFRPWPGAGSALVEFWAGRRAFISEELPADVQLARTWLQAMNRRVGRPHPLSEKPAPSPHENKIRWGLKTDEVVDPDEIMKLEPELSSSEPLPYLRGSRPGSESRCRKEFLRSSSR
jgi:hypothetical protein